jgi:hypothetical protein
MVDNDVLASIAFNNFLLGEFVMPKAYLSGSLEDDEPVYFF